MMGGFDGLIGTFGVLWMLLPILFWSGILALIVWGVVRFFPERRGGERPEARGQSAEKVLTERFVRGEIDAEEYERSLGFLRNGRDPLKGGV
jgi:putative membrane protein